MGEFPYTVLIRTSDYPTKLPTAFDYWGSLPDAFDAGFRAYVQSQVSQELVGHNGRTTFMGVFVDDELSWGTVDTLERRYAVAIAALRASSTQPAKRALVDSMKRRYRKVSNLNRDWGTSFASWDAMLTNRSYTLPALPTTALRRDLGDFVRSFANAYYSAVRNALNVAQCTGLYLGSRDAWYTPETTDIAAAYVDVISINRFGRDYTVDFSFASMRKPVMITSFSFGAMDRGHFSGGISQVLDQGSRGDYLRNYVTQALQSAKVVGVHFFEFYDQPIVGRRYDGENYNQGFVRVTDDPYTELVAAARFLGNSLYSVRGQ
jgi:agarase